MRMYVTHVRSDKVAWYSEYPYAPPIRLNTRSSYPETPRRVDVSTRCGLSIATRSCDDKDFACERHIRVVTSSASSSRLVVTVRLVAGSHHFECKMTAIYFLFLARLTCYKSSILLSAHLALWVDHVVDSTTHGGAAMRPTAHCLN
jgi:hypothetical protein